MSELFETVVLLLQAGGAALPSQAALSRRVDSLSRLYRTEVARQERTLAWRPSDTVVAGAVTLAFPPQYRRRLTPAVRRAAADWDRLHGQPAPAVWITVAGDPASSVLHVRASRTPAGPAEGASRFVRTGPWAAGDPDRALWESLAGILLESADSSFRAWLPVTVGPLGDRSADDDLAYQWLMVRGPATQACRAGAKDRCRAALGLAGHVEGELTVAVRGAVFAAALARGGPGAWRTFLQSSGRPLPDRIEAIAGISVGGLVEEWRGGLFDRRQRTGFEDPWRWAMAALWGIGTLGLVVVSGRSRV